MSNDEPAAQRLAAWWVETYTRTAPPAAAADRRAEVASDVFEQRAYAQATGASERELSWAVTTRVLRGVPSDLTWRLEVEPGPGRMDWHLRHPTTVFGLALVVLVPLVLAGDLVQSRARDLDPRAGWPQAGMLGWAGWLLSCAVVAFGLLALVRVRPQRPSSSWVTPRRLRGAPICAMSFLWALSGVWRFSPGISRVSDLAWVGFGLALVAYALAVILGLVVGGVGKVRHLDFRKVPS